MIRHAAFSPEPWRIREQYLELDLLAQTESVFALGNGHLGLRGNLEEGEPAGMPGTYLNSVFERRPLPYAEAGYGYPEAGQTLINVTDGKLLRLLVDDEPFDVRYGELLSHERILDLQTGLLHREAEWRSPAGQVVRVRTTRLVSFTQRSIAAIHYEVEAVDDSTRIVVQSELVANEPLPDIANDPRVAAALQAPLESQDYACDHLAAVLVHRTAASGLGVAVAMNHTVDGPDGTESSSTVDPDIAGPRSRRSSSRVSASGSSSSSRTAGRRPGRGRRCATR